MNAIERSTSEWRNILKYAFLLLFFFVQNIICYFECFIEKIYKIKKYVRIQKDLKENYSWPSNAIDHNALPRLRNIMVSPHADVFEFVNTSRRFAIFQLKITVWSTMSKRNLEWEDYKEKITKKRITGKEKDKADPSGLCGSITVQRLSANVVWRKVAEVI